jgi:hypothetical protein
MGRGEAYLPVGRGEGTASLFLISPSLTNLFKFSRIQPTQRIKMGQRVWVIE